MIREIGVEERTWRWRLGWFIVSAFSGIGLLLVGQGASAESLQASRADVPVSAYEHAQTLVTLPSGRRLNLFCMGAGTPVVILEAGGGDDSLSFRHVQGRLAALTRVCAYDRAGMGFSDPSDAPSTATHVVNDLYALIRQAGIPSPVILAGHSNGGLYATLYAAKYPQDVAGMVLIDPLTLGQDITATQVLSPKQVQDWRTSNQQDVTQGRLCLKLAQSGVLASTPDRYPNCMDSPPNANVTLHRLLNTQLARPTEQSALFTELLDTHPPADGGLSKAELALQQAQFEFGDKPFIVLSGTDETYGLPSRQRKKVWQALSDSAEALAAHSTHGVHVIVKNSGHYIQEDQPDAVVRAVMDVVRSARLRFAPQPNG